MSPESASELHPAPEPELRLRPEPAASPEPVEVPIVLIGAPGSGKSTVGAMLAERLGLTFRDVDAVIVERTGKPITEIFTDDGEPVFRALEEQITAELLPLPGVLSLGGGAILSAATRGALQSHRVVWLKVGLAQSVRRVGLDTARPLLLGNVRGRLRKLLDERAELYREVATEVIDTDEAAPADIVEMIMRAHDTQG
jgi:shikimate kinase